MIKNPLYFVLISGLLVSLTGCATWSNRTKSIVASVGTGLVVGTVAACLAPGDEHAIAHGAMWGGPSAAAVGITSLFIFDEQKRSEEFERQNQVLKKELDVYRNPTLGAESSLDGTPSFPKQIPQGLQGLVDPGKWTYTRLPKNTWRWHGTHAVVRECEKFEFIPPRLKLGFSEPELMLNEDQKVGEGAEGESVSGKDASQQKKSQDFKARAKNKKLVRPESKKKETENKKDIKEQGEIEDENETD